jgi:DNA-binding NarL/FixJ family response regulator
MYLYCILEYCEVVMSDTKRFLISEDDDMYRMSLSRAVRTAFNRRGLPEPVIEEADCVDSTLRKLRTDVFDAIIIDRGLPWYDTKRQEQLLSGGMGGDYVLPQAIKRKGPNPNMCDEINEKNRNAIVAMITGLDGYANRSFEGIDMVYEKGDGAFPVERLLTAMKLPLLVPAKDA